MVVQELEIFLLIDYKHFDKTLKIDRFCCLKNNIDRGDKKVVLDGVLMCGKMEGEEAASCEHILRNRSNKAKEYFWAMFASVTELVEGQLLNLSKGGP